MECEVFPLGQPEGMDSVAQRMRTVIGISTARELPWNSTLKQDNIALLFELKLFGQKSLSKEEIRRRDITMNREFGSVNLGSWALIRSRKSLQKANRGNVDSDSRDIAADSAYELLVDLRDHCNEQTGPIPWCAQLQNVSRNYQKKWPDCLQILRYHVNYRINTTVHNWWRKTCQSSSVCDFLDPPDDGSDIEIVDNRMSYHQYYELCERNVIREVESQKNREVLLLYLKGYTYEEISKKHDIPVARIRKQIQRFRVGVKKKDMNKNWDELVTLKM